ncbi:unnamed protein product, partial [Brenthis ino]
MDEFNESNIILLCSSDVEEETILNSDNCEQLVEKEVLATIMAESRPVEKRQRQNSDDTENENEEFITHTSKEVGLTETQEIQNDLHNSVLVNTNKILETRSYRDVLITTKQMPSIEEHEDMSNDVEGMNDDDTEGYSKNPCSSQGNKKKENRKKNSIIVQNVNTDDTNYLHTEKSASSIELNNNQDVEKDNLNKFKDFFRKLKEIILSKRDFKEKICDAFYLVIEEICISFPSLRKVDIAMNLDWTTINENLGSDHLMLKYTLRYKDKLSFTKKRNYKNANWIEYKNILEKEFNEFDFETNDIQIMYDKFIQRINLAADKAIPYIKYCNNLDQKFVPKPFWNQTLSKIVAERRLALKNLRRNPTPHNLDILEQKVTEARMLIVKVESESWHSFCSDIDENTTVMDMWRKMQWMKGLRRAKICTSDERKQTLLESLAPDFVSPNIPLLRSKNEALESPFTYSELDNTLKQKNSSPGDDNISYSIIRCDKDNSFYERWTSKGLAQGDPL